MPLVKWSRCYALNLLLFSSVITLKAASAQSPATSTSPEAPANHPVVSAKPLTLDFIAIDRDGKPVTDLKPEELHLSLNKMERKVEAVSPAASDSLTIGLFFDISGSRRNDRSIGEETRLAGELVHSLWHEGDTAFVLAFNNELYAMTQPTHKLDDINQGLQRVMDATYYGSTSLYDALCLLKPEKLAAIPGRKVYVVFSDFEDNASRNKKENVFEVARQAKVSIFPIILGKSFIGSPSKKIEKHSRELAQAIANETGGEVLIPESRKQLPSIFQRLTAELQSAYRLTYFPSTASPNSHSKSGRIQIITTREHVKLFYPKS
jgi:VWFA-related protein